MHPDMETSVESRLLAGSLSDGDESDSLSSASSMRTSLLEGGGESPLHPPCLTSSYDSRQELSPEQPAGSCFENLVWPEHTHDGGSPSSHESEESRAMDTSPE